MNVAEPDDLRILDDLIRCHERERDEFLDAGVSDAELNHNAKKLRLFRRSRDWVMRRRAAGS